MGSHNTLSGRQDEFIKRKLGWYW